MRAWLVGAVVAVCGCVEPQLTLCGDGTACPASLACDVAHGSCVAPDQLTACAGLADGTACHTSELAGDCFDGVCLPPGCGNRVVEPGEQCDDGNHVGGDGCSQDCRSNERCGNGVLDDALGEQCDDGNLASHDGCDSRCGIETVTWQMAPAALAGLSSAAFDAAHGKLVMIGNHVTWLWDGTAWSTPMALLPDADSWSFAIEDSDRARVVAFGQRSMTAIVAEWDGSQWTERTIGGIAPSVVYAVAYDPVHHVIWWLDDQNLGELDLAAATPVWGATTLLPFQLGAAQVAFDESRQTLVVVDAQGGGTWEWDGMTWTRATASPVGSSGHALVFDPIRGQLLALGGRDANGVLANVSAWTGTSWDDTRARIPARSNATAWYDPARHVIGFAGGADGTLTGLRDILDLDGDTVTAHSVVLPSDYGAFAYDATGDRVVALDNTGTYAWNGTWQLVSASAPRRDLTTLVYDPGRRVMLAVDTQNLEILALGSDWQPLIRPPGGAAATYDYGRQGLVIVNGSGAFLLPSNGSTFSAIAPAPPSGPLYAGYDVGMSSVAIEGFGGLTDLVGGAWQPSLSPPGNATPISALQTRSLMLVPLHGGTQLWERRNGAFRALEPLPFATQIEYAAAGSRGRLLLEADASPGVVYLIRQLSSGLPDETCAPGQDADGDGLAGCDDPDCWETCWPACPVATSCP